MCSFEEVQTIRFVAYDYDKYSAPDCLGMVETTLGKVMGSRGSTLTLPLQHYPGAPLVNIGKATLTIFGCEQRAVNDILRIQFRAASLDKKDWFGSSDPFVTIYRIKPDMTRQKVCDGQ